MDRMCELSGHVQKTKQRKAATRGPSTWCVIRKASCVGPPLCSYLFCDTTFFVLAGQVCIVSFNPRSTLKYPSYLCERGCCPLLCPGA